MKHKAFLFTIVAVASVATAVLFAGRAWAVPQTIYLPGNGIINSSGIGIGTTSPDSIFTVKGTAASTSPYYNFDIYDSNGVLRTALRGSGSQAWWLNSGLGEVGSIAYSTPGGQPGIVFENVSGAGRSQITLLGSMGGLGFGATSTSAGPPNQLVLTNSGNVGIGTASPVGNLDVASLGGAILLVRDSNGSAGTIRVTNAGGNNYIESGLTTSGGSAAPLYFTNMNDANTWMAIASSGNVGIGTATPAYTLDVNGQGSFEGNVLHNIGTPLTGTDAANKSYVDTAVSNAGGGVWTLSGSNVYVTNTGDNVGIGTASPGSQLTIVSPGNTTGAYFTVLPNNLTQSVNIGFNHIWEAGSNGNNTLALDSQGSGYLLLQAAGGTGNVGIGTTAPNAPLEIQKDTGNGTEGDLLRLNSVSGSAGNGPGILFTNNGDVLNLARIAGLDAGNWGGDLAFYTSPGTGSSPGGTPTERMLIDSSGNVGIETTAPGYTLDVNGTGHFSGKLTANTIDPLYTIAGTNYSTYVPGMTGEKEETAGVVDLQKNADGTYSATMNFATAAKGSDLWLFAQATNLAKTMSQLIVSLTPSFDGNVWYTKDAAADTLTLHGSAAGEISYNLTAPRFDAAQWPNLAPADEANTTGLIIK